MEGRYTKEDIEKLKERDPSELTPEERRLRNLTPVKEGEIKNPKGRGKGVPNWSTHFKRLMGDEQFLKTIISTMPKQWQNIVQEIPADVIAAALIATITQDAAKSIIDQKPISGETLKAIQLLNKISYGDKVQLEPSEEGFFQKPVIKFEVVPDRPRPTNNQETTEVKS